MADRKPNFIKRLEDPNRKSIPDWSHSGKINYLSPNWVNQFYDRFYPKVATHKMSAEYYHDNSGRAIAYPDVQEINGRLVDFTRPPYAPWAGYDSAIQNKDYLMFDNLQDAIRWTETYKDKYKNFKK